MCAHALVVADYITYVLFNIYARHWFHLCNIVIQLKDDDLTKLSCGCVIVDKNLHEERKMLSRWKFAH